jgi:hypothetical protein
MVPMLENPGSDSWQEVLEMYSQDLAAIGTDQNIFEVKNKLKSLLMSITGITERHLEREHSAHDELIPLH